MRSWRDYPASSVRKFLKFHTDGEPGVGGRRYECSECGAEYSNHFQVRQCWQLYHGGENFDAGEFDPEEHAIPIEFDENGERIND